MSSRSPAYAGYGWGILAGGAWGVSRVADFLVTDPSVDHQQIIVTGASRNGKSAMVAAAFDDRLIGPVVTGGGGGCRFIGPRHSETLDIMRKKYSNWFSPKLHEFWGERDRLPFDHWFLALAAPRHFIAPEGMTETISYSEALRHSILGAVPPTTDTVAKDRLGVNYANHGHTFTAEDSKAMVDFFDRRLRGKKIDRPFDRFSTERKLNDAAAQPVI